MHDLTWICFCGFQFATSISLSANQKPLQQNPVSRIGYQHENILGIQNPDVA